MECFSNILYLLHRVPQVLGDPRRGERAEGVARHGEVGHAVALRDDLHGLDHVPEPLRLEVEAHGDVWDFHLLIVCGDGGIERVCIRTYERSG